MTNKIVIPTDFSEASLKALDMAKQAADAFDAELHVMTAVQAPIVFQPTMAASYPSIDELRKEAMERLEAYEKEHLASWGRTVHKIVFEGRASDEICRYAEEIDATMIVMATHGHSGLAHIVIGSTTENVVRHAKCPVLSVRA